MTPLEAGAILCAGLAAGTINTIVGSGSLITFPLLLVYRLASRHGVVSWSAARSASASACRSEDSFDRGAGVITALTGAGTQ